jgi:pimeloyl-ACP methyl ester carboxylesterase
MTRDGYLPGGARVVVHEPATSGRTALVVVPPFGFEEVSSYRARRAMAVAFAAAGHPVARLELPGTGDSDGEYDDPGLVDSWVRAVTEAAQLLRAAGAARVAVVGLGLGGLLGCLAAGSTAIDDLVLWAVPGRGRTLLRQVRAFALLQGAASPEPRADGSMWFYGYPMSAETVARLEAVDLAETQFGRPGMRALVLSSDRLQPDRHLLAALQRTSVDVTTAAGDGYAAMVGNPQTAVTPRAAITVIIDWLSGAPGTGTTTDVASMELRDTLTLDHATERPLALPVDGETAAAVVTAPGQPADRCLLLLNAGANRRTGPNRMWVRAARAAAADGVAAVRVDLPGLGDASGPDDWTGGDAAFYAPERQRQVRQVMDGLVEAGLPARFVIGGLCSGAYWGFWAAQEDPRVASVVMLNPRALVWEPWRADVAAGHDVVRLKRARTWRRILTGRVSAAHGRAVLLALARRAFAPTAVRHRRTARTLDAALDRLQDMGTSITLALSAEEPVLAEVTREQRFAPVNRWSNVDFRLLGGSTEVHTLAPPELQATASALLADAVARSR